MRRRRTCNVIIVDYNSRNLAAAVTAREVILSAISEECGQVAKERHRTGAQSDHQEGDSTDPWLPREVIFVAPKNHMYWCVGTPYVALRQYSL